MKKTIRNIEYLIEMLNDEFDKIVYCEEDCPFYKSSCRIVTKDHHESLCGIIAKAINNK